MVNREQSAALAQRKLIFLRILGAALSPIAPSVTRQRRLDIIRMERIKRIPGDDRLAQFKSSLCIAVHSPASFIAL
jgi:hypothetical protein